MDKSLTKTNTPLGLDPAVLSQLETYGDFLSYYIQLEETSSAFSWLKADLLHEFVKRHGEKSLEALSQDLKVPRPTISNYTKVSKAFPRDKRLPNASFTMHLVACFADEYDNKKDEFVSDKRYEFIEKAVDNQWSTRRLQRELQDIKTIEVKEQPFCTYCGKTDDIIGEYLVYRTQVRRDPEKLKLHEECFQQIIGTARKFNTPQ